MGKWEQVSVYVPSLATSDRSLSFPTLFLSLLFWTGLCKYTAHN